MPDQESGSLTLQELLSLAHSLAWSRPMQPYPGWCFSSDYDRDEIPYRLRRIIWHAFQAQGEAVTLPFLWQDIRLTLNIGNDLSLPLFVGGCFDPNEFFFLHHYLKPHMTFVDVGANEGLYSLFAAKRVASVHSFEPSSREFARLCHNIDQNDLSHVHPYQMALADYSGWAELTIAEASHAGQNTLGQFAYAGVEASARERVLVRPLDDLLNSEKAKRIDFIKIDVEGAEVAILRGSRKTLAHCRPGLLLEISEPSLAAQGESRASLWALLSDAGYNIFTFATPTGWPAPWRAEAASDNVIALPHEVPMPSFPVLTATQDTQ